MAAVTEHTGKSGHGADLGGGTGPPASCAAIYFSISTKVCLKIDLCGHYIYESVSVGVALRLVDTMVASPMQSGGGGSHLSWHATVTGASALDSPIGLGSDPESSLCELLDGPTFAPVGRHRSRIG